MNAEAEESLRLRLGALRIDPPSNGFDERLRARLELEAQHPVRRAEVMRPARFRIRGGRVGLLTVAALCFAGAAAAVVGTRQHLALWSSPPQGAPALELPKPLAAQTAKRSPRPISKRRVEPLAPTHAAPPSPIVEVPSAAPTEVAPPRVPRLATSLVPPGRPEQSHPVELPRLPGPSEQQTERNEQPTPAQIPRLQARLEPPEINRNRDAALSLSDERQPRHPEQRALPRQAERARQQVERRLEERFERRGGPAQAHQRATERPSVERRNNAGAGRARGGRPD